MEPLITQALSTLMDLTQAHFPADVRLGAAQSLLTFAFDAAPEGETEEEQDASTENYIPNQGDDGEEFEDEAFEDVAPPVTLSPEEAAARAQILAEQAQAEAPVRNIREGSEIGSRRV